MRFSIVVPAYNAERTLSATLGAISAQHFASWECVVVDDGSSDSTCEIVNSFISKDGRFSLITQDNQGTAGAYNTGVKAALGDWIVICSADDILLPGHLCAMSADIDANPDFDIRSSNGYYLFGANRREMVYLPGEMPESMSMMDALEHCFYGVGAAYRRGMHSDIGGYRLAVYGEDYDFWLRAIASGYRHHYVDEPLSLHRIGEEQKTADRVSVLRSDIEILENLRASSSLSNQEDMALSSAIRTRQAAIEGLGNPVTRFRTWLLSVAFRLFGRTRVRTAIRRLRMNRK